MPSFELPASWTQDEPAAAAEAAVVSDQWWTAFNDATLNALEAEGLAANDDIALAAGRVAEARAYLRLSDADLYPNLSAEAGAGRISRSREEKLSALGTSSSKPYNDFTLSAVLDYEVDLWGKLRRASESARAQLLSEKANRDAVRLAVASDIATGYFTLLALDSQASITRDTIKTRQAAFDYQSKQYKAGSVDVLTYQRANAELAAAQAALPVLEQARVEQQDALSILLGRSPKAIVEAVPPTDRKISSLPVPPKLPLDAPSTLLERRPDVSAAEQQLIAANAEIGVAKADYYPTLSLSALLGLGASDVDRVLRSSARTWQLGAASAVPLLDFGRTGANVDAAEARKTQAMASYQQTVRHAFGDVVDAMSRVQTSDARVAAQARQVKAYGEASRVAGLRYDAGYATQLDQLDAERQLFQAQLDQIDALQQRLSASVSLYKALGGGWNPQGNTPSKVAPAKPEAAPAPTSAPAPISAPDSRT
jgi:multidrug efflux system outer membrane protein